MQDQRGNAIREMGTLRKYQKEKLKIKSSITEIENSLMVHQ